MGAVEEQAAMTAALMKRITALERAASVAVTPPGVATNAANIATNTADIAALAAVDVASGNDPVMASGWSLTSFYATQAGPILSFAVYFTRTGAQINQTADDLPNTVVCTFVPALRGSVTYVQSCVAAANGPPLGGVYQSSTGLLYVTNKRQDLETGDVLSLGGTVIL